MNDDPRDPEPEPDDPLPGLIAEVDQALRTVPMLAAAAWTMYESFTEAGFEPRQALYLTACQLHAGGPGQP